MDEETLAEIARRLTPGMERLKFEWERFGEAVQASRLPEFLRAYHPTPKRRYPRPRHHWKRRR